ncbi:MAG: hypothetical protein JWM77_573 [Rhodospirillales bacterium]|nr:hypothetical protein [Rhodospirillales bacterium]
MQRALLFFYLLLAGTAQAAPPPTKADQELTVTAPRRLWSTEEEIDARHRADYERLKQKFDPDPPAQTEVGRLRAEMARPAGQRDSPLREYFRTR